jgi:hypothetical protein
MSTEIRWELTTQDFESFKVRDHYFLPQKIDKPFYVSVFRYGKNFKEYIESGYRFANWRGLSYTDFFLFDFDSKKGDLRPLQMDLREFLETLVVEFDLDLKSLRICFTGHKGFEVGIPTKLFNYAPMISPEPYFKRFALILVEGLRIAKYHDLNAHAPHRFVRLVNSQHEESDLYKIPLTVDEIYSLSPKQIRKLAEKPRIIDWIARPGELSLNEGLHAYWMEILSTTRVIPEIKTESLIKYGEEKGGRHDKAFVIAINCRDAGRTLDESLSTLLIWNRKNKPPIPSHIWFKQMLRSVFRHRPTSTIEYHPNADIQAFIRTLNHLIDLNDHEFRAFVTAMALTNTETKVWEGITIEPGSFVSSLESLAHRSGGSVKKSHTRTLMDKLKARKIISSVKLPGNLGQLFTWRTDIKRLFVKDN